MGCLGNVIWFLCGGVISGLSWLLTGCLWCITIIGIPVGMQCFKFAALSFFPFGKEITYVCYVLQLSEFRLDCSILKSPSWH